LVVSREHTRHFGPEQPIEALTASEETIRLQWVLSDDAGEVRPHCHSAGAEAAALPRPRSVNRLLVLPFVVLIAQMKRAIPSKETI
jgi:hypothetical protein